MSNTIIRNARHSETSGFTPVFYADHVAHLLSFLCCVFFALFVFIFFFVTNVACIWIVHS